MRLQDSEAMQQLLNIIGAECEFNMLRLMRWQPIELKDAIQIISRATDARS